MTLTTTADGSRKQEMARMTLELTDPHPVDRAGQILTPEALPGAHRARPGVAHAAACEQVA